MKAGVDLGKRLIFVETKAGGLQTSVSLTAAGARFLAEQLIQSANALDKYNEGEFGKVDCGTEDK